MSQQHSDTESVKGRKVDQFDVVLWIGYPLFLLLIAAILFPVFAKVHGRRGHGSCQSAEKLLGLAMLQYTQDYDGMFPLGTSPAIAPSPQCVGLGWGGQTFPYTKSTGSTSVLPTAVQTRIR